jgi:serine/threonine-protein kinase
MQDSIMQPPDGTREGDLLAGKYRIERRIGEGGMGVVVVARHIELDELVAIKFLLPQALGNPEAVMRFAREARASVKIKSEFVARTFDVGKLESGAPFMVMEYLQGSDLGDRVRNSGPLPIQQTVDFILQACQALADAHVIGIIHRDIKPSNLFVIRRSDGNESIKLLDFGISKVTGAAASGADMGMTRTQALMGSPLYMSPEQMASTRNVGVSTDIWAIGITLYELLSGHTPFEGESITELCANVLTRPTPTLTERPLEIPQGLQSVLNRCLQKAPADRYANVAELALALKPYGSTRGQLSADAALQVLQAAGILVRTTEALAVETQAVVAIGTEAAIASKTEEAAMQPAASTGTVANWSQTHPESKQKKNMMLGMGAFGIAVIAILATLLVMSRRTVEPPAATVAAPILPSTVEGVPSVAAPLKALVAQSAPAASPSVAITGGLPAPAQAAPGAANTAPARYGKQKPSGSPAGPREPHKRAAASEVTDFGGRVF